MKMSEQLFEQLTWYMHQTNTKPYNGKRAEILGIGGRDVQVAPGAQVRIPPEQIGKNVFIGLFSYLNGDVTIEDYVLIGPHCSIVAGNHRYSPVTDAYYPDREEDVPVVIGRGSWIASNVTITPGVHIGKANLICAGAVVTKSTPDYAIMAGVPAKRIGKVNPETGTYEYFHGGEEK